DTLDGFQRTQTKSYDAASGAIFWSSIYGNTVGAEHLIPLDVAVGRQGEVFLSIASNQGGYSTVKFEASSGALTWGPVLEPNAPSPDAVSLQVATNGDLFEHDTTYDASGFHLATRRYDGGSGATVWGPEIADVAGFSTLIE